MARRAIIVFIGLFIAGGFSQSCKTVFQPRSVQYKDYRIDHGAKADSAIYTMLKPYADSVSKSMNDLVAVSETVMENQQPEGTLGNLLADAMLFMAKQNYHMQVDAAFINFGGIRLPALPAGNITRGKIFELAPFDNVLVLQKIPGKVLQEFLDHLAGRGGWPCAGITWQIRNKKAVNIKIGGHEIDEKAIYTIANNDYVANGGDDCVMLRGISQVNNGYLFRDALIGYFTMLHKEGKKLTSAIEKRVSNAD